jgi:hypothetical protein
MPQVGYQPTTPTFEWAKTVPASDRAATVKGVNQPYLLLFSLVTAFMIMTKLREFCNELNRFRCLE